MSKKIIAVDLDDVLSVSVPELVAYSNKNYGTNISVDDYDEELGQMWGVSVSETHKRLDEFHKSGVFLRYRQIQDAYDTVLLLKEDFELIITTSRRRIIAPHTLEWVDKEYPGVFEDVHFAGIWDNYNATSRHATKADLLVELGADFLIDDQPKHCIGALEAGVTPLLFGNYPWNSRGALPSDITRVTDWAEVKRYFDELV